MVEKLTEVLELVDMDSSYCQLAAGSLPSSNIEYLDEPQFKWLKNAMRMTLKAMDPYPAVLTDRYGKLLMVNKGWVAFHSQLVDKEYLLNTTNHYELLFSRKHNNETSEVKKNTLALILMALKQEYLLTQDDAYSKMFERLLTLPDVPNDWQQRAAKLEPQASFKVQIDINHVQQNFYSVSQMVGALGPTSFVSEPRLTINTLYPENPGLELSIEGIEDYSHPLLHY